MSNPIEYEKPPPYSPYPQVSVHTYGGGVEPTSFQSQSICYQQPTGYQSFPSQPVLSNNPPNYGTTTVTVPVQEIIIVGTCPACRVGVVEDDYTCLGIFCAIFFFPFGILACLLLKNRRCPNCGAYFG